MAEEIKLPPDTLDKLRESNTTIKEVEKFISKAALAGYSVDQPKQRLSELKTQLRKTRDAFYPGQEL